MIYLIFIGAGLVMGAALGGEAAALGGAAGFFLAMYLDVKARSSKQFREIDERITRLELQLGARAAPREERAPSTQPPVEPAEAKPPPVSVTPAPPPPTADAAVRPQPPVALREPAKPQTPSGLQVFFGDARKVLLGGNTLVRVGVLILIVGLGLLAKYAAQQQLFPIEMRLASMLLTGAVLVGLGWRLRTRRFGYAAALQGGGVGVMYLCIFFALRPYELIPAGMAAALLIGVAVTGSVLAVVQSSLALAIMGTLGGFLAPVLASTGAGNHVALFSYYALLNGAIFAMAWFRAWRPLNLLGFACTFGIATAWGVLRYDAANFATTEPFLILFFLFYTAIPILYARKESINVRGVVDGSLVFGTPLVVYSLQTPLVLPYKFGLAYSSLALGFFYVMSASVLLRRSPERMRDMAEAFLALGIGFATLTIPQALDNQHFTAAVWALEGAGILWIGVRQGRLLPRLSGIALQFAGGAAFIYQGTGKGALPIANSEFLGAAFIAGAGLFSAVTLHRGREKLRKQELALGAAFLVWAVLWWMGAVTEEVGDQVVRDYRMIVTLAVAAASALGLEWLGTRISWQAVRRAAFTLFPVTLLGLLHLLMIARHPVAHGGFLSWPFVIAMHYVLLKRNDGLMRPWAERLLHGITYWVITLLLIDEAAWAVHNIAGLGDNWEFGVTGAILVSALIFIRRFAAGFGWPFKQHPEAYLRLTGASLAIAAWLWTIVSSLRGSADPRPLFYIPLLNPVELPVLVAVVAILRWYVSASQAFESLARLRVRRLVIWSLGGTLFLWVNVLALRTIHHWVGVPYHADLLYHSGTVQTSISILWTLVAFSLMIVATRGGARPVWVTGAVLLGLVVVKLFAVDLSNTAMTGRIVSFVGVGVLLLLIGYVAPVPPALVDPGRADEPAAPKPEPTGEEPS